MSHFGPRRRKQISEQSSLVAPEPLELRLFLSVSSVSTNPLVSAPLAGSAPTVLGSASTVSSSQNVLTSAEIHERSATVSVISAAGDSSAFRYEWQVTETPAGGTLTFAKNATNAAKINTLTFGRTGTYVVRVRVQNAGSVLSSDTLQFNVVQTFARIGVKTADGRAVTAGGLIVSGTSQQLSAVALDQFGTPLVEQPAIAWQIVKLPTGSTPELVTEGNSVSASFNRAGAYALRAQAGLLRFDAPIKVAQTMTSFTLATSDNVAVESDQTLTVTESAADRRKCCQSGPTRHCGFFQSAVDGAWPRPVRQCDGKASPDRLDDNIRSGRRQCVHSAQFRHSDRLVHENRQL